MKKILYVIIFISLLSGCSSKDVYTKDLLYMETFINIKIYSSNSSLVEKSFDKIDDMFNEYDKLSDRYHSYDDIINVDYINKKLPLNKEIKIDSKLYDVLEYSKSYYDKTNKLFNITLGHVIDVWSDYRSGIKKGIPDINELKNSGSIDSEGLVLKGDNKIVKTSDISIDLGAIAKGYVTELAGDYLESVGLNEYIITAGTSSVKAGKHYDNSIYKIGIINPEKTNELYKIIKGNNLSVTTSGSFNKYFEYEGIRYHHIIDPVSLFPLNHMLSVTVITDDAALGEILSTTLFLMPIDEGIEYLDNFDNVEAIWYGIDGKITKTNGFDKYE